MTFPSVTATTSPLAVLPQFVEVLGRKMDKISSEMDWGSKRKTSKRIPDISTRNLEQDLLNGPLIHISTL